MAKKRKSPAGHSGELAGGHIVLKKLEAFGALSAEEREAFLEILEYSYVVAAGKDLVADGSAPNSSVCLIEGLACRYKLLSGARRQIMSLLFAGDITDLQSYVLKKMDHAIGALTDCTVANIPHAALREITARFPNLAQVLWRDTAIESAMLRTWLTGLGRKTALSRVAHFFCEQFTRLEAVGLTSEKSVRLGITQIDLADALGLSLVHTNRVLQELRQDGVIEMKSKTLTINDWKELRRLGEFDPSYLQFRQG